MKVYKPVVIVIIAIYQLNLPFTQSFNRILQLATKFTSSKQTKNTNT